MNGQFQVAQASGTGNSNNATPPRIFKLTKPLGDQAVVVNLGYDQKVQVDFSAIANEKITLLHVGEKLIVLFDNQSTVTVEPFFDSRHDALQNLTIEVAPGRDLSVSEFASSFPISTDQSVLPAAGNGNGNGNAQASGANFGNPAVDPLPPIPTNVLAPPEVLPNFNVTVPTGFIPLIQPTIPTTAPGPTITAGLGPSFVVDESFIPGIGSHTGPAGSNIDTEASAASFTVTAPAGVQSLTFALTINNATTNLIDSVSGQVVHLVQNGAGEVDGVVTINNVQTNVFTLTVDGTGHVTLTDLRGVHQGAGENGDISEGISLAPGLVSLTATVTDINNATASASLDLGPQITVHDDGPTIQVQINGEEGPRFPTLSVDESNLPTGTTPNATLTVSHGDFSGSFTSAAGADGATITYAVAVQSANVDSGLIDSVSGQHVLLSVNGSGVVEGHTAIGGDLVFTLEVNSATGVVTLTDFRAVHQGSPDTPTDISEGISLNSIPNLVTLTATITDADGDHRAATIDLGKRVSFLDDGLTVNFTAGPSVGALEVVEASGVVGDQVATITAPTFTASAVDGVTTTVGYTLSLVGSTATGIVTTAGNHPITLHLDSPTQISGLYDSDGNGTLDATAFTVTLSGNQATLTSVVALEHDNTNVSETLNLNGLINVVSTVTATDGDNDVVVASAATASPLSLTFNDTNPTVTPVLTSLPTLAVDESFIPNVGSGVGSAVGGPTSNISTQNFGADFTVNGGADGQLGATAYSLTLNGGASSLATTLVDSKTGGAVTLVQVSTTEIDAKDTANDVVFKLTVDSSSGIVTLTDLRGVHEGTGETPDASEFITLASGLASVTATVTDNDADKAVASIDLGGQIKIFDDGPIITAVQNAIIPALANTDVQGTWQPAFGADGQRFAPAGDAHGANDPAFAAIGIAVGPAPAGLTYTVTDTLTHNPNGEEVFSVAVTGGAQAYNFFEYTHYDASTKTAELFAYTDQTDAD